MRALKTLLRAKKTMRNCNDCKCITLNAWKCMEELCNCGDATVGTMEWQAKSIFANSPVLKNLKPADTAAAIAEANAIIDAAWEELRPFYNALQEGMTFEEYVTENNLKVDDTGTCDDALVDNEAAFTLYVSAMWLIDCKYLWLDKNDKLINAAELADYLDYINAD